MAASNEFEDVCQGDDAAGPPVCRGDIDPVISGPDQDLQQTNTQHSLNAWLLLTHVHVQRKASQEEIYCLPPVRDIHSHRRQDK